MVLSFTVRWKWRMQTKFRVTWQKHICWLILPHSPLSMTHLACITILKVAWVNGGFIWRRGGKATGRSPWRPLMIGSFDMPSDVFVTHLLKAYLLLLSCGWYTRRYSSPHINLKKYGCFFCMVRMFLSYFILQSALLKMCFYLLCVCVRAHVCVLCVLVHLCVCVLWYDTADSREVYR